MLVVGADNVFLPALRLALARHRVHVETAPMAEAVEAAVVAAPDLILLAGDAARDAGHDLLSKLTSSPVSSVIPVALLGDDTTLDTRLNAFRHGAAAVIPRSASIDAVAETVAKLAREIPERGGDALGQVGEATLEEFVSALTRELRSGILSVTPGAGDDKAPIRLVLGGGRPLAAFIDEFVARVRRHVVQAEPLHYEFDDRAGGTVQVLPAEQLGSEPPPSNVQGLRLLLADDNPARVDVITQELRRRGAEVAVSALSPSDAELARLRVMDPEVVIVGERELEGQGYALLRRMKRDTRLRWTSLLVVRWEELSDASLLMPVVERITGPIAELAEADRALSDRAELGDPFDARLEVNGPARCLRALAASGRPLRVTITNPRLHAELDLSDKLVVGATATSPKGERWEGAAALAALLMISSGRVRVEPSASPATTNLMAPADAAFDLAEREIAPIAPSLPAPASVSQPPAAEQNVVPGPAALPGAASADPFAQTLAQAPGDAGPAGALRPDPFAQTQPQAASAAPPSRLDPFAETRPQTPAAHSLRARSASQSSLAAQSSPASQSSPAPQSSLTPHSSLAPRSSATPRASLLPRPSSAPKLARRGVSAPFAALLVGLAVAQGLLFAGAYRLFKRHADAAPASALAAPHAPAPAVPRAPAPTPKLATPPAKPVAPPPAAVSNAGAAADAPQPVAEDDATPIPAVGRDESGQRAPTCDELLGAAKPAGAQNPGAAFEQLKRARRAVVIGKAEDAQRAYCMAIRWDSQNPDYYFELAQVLLIRRDGAAAAEAAKQGIELAPANTKGQGIVGDGLARIGEVDAARRAWFAAAGVNNPSAAEIQHLTRRSLGEAEQALANRDYVRAERFYRRASLLDTKNAEARRGLATALLRLGDGKNALAWARAAHALSAEDPAIQVTLGDALLAVGDVAGARKAYEDAQSRGYADARRRLRRLNR